MSSSNQVFNESKRVTFLGNDIYYTDDTLTPRLETESLVLGVLPILDTIDTVIDVGTGTGCIALAIACRAPNLRYFATDISAWALAVAAYNFRSSEWAITPIHGNLTWGILADLSQGTRILVIANLPYIPMGTVLPADVLCDDPALALWGNGRDGLDIVRSLIQELIGYKDYFHITVALELFEGQVDILSAENMSMIDNFQSWNDVCGIKRFCSFTFSHEDS